MVIANLSLIRNKLNDLKSCDFFKSKKTISYPGRDNLHKGGLIPKENYISITFRCDGTWHQCRDEKGNELAHLCPTTEKARLKFLIKKLTGIDAG